MEVDQAYLVSVSDLQTICKELSTGDYQYSVLDSFTQDSKKVRISFNNDKDNLNCIIFTFPIVAYLGLPEKLTPNSHVEDCLIVGLHVYTYKQERYSLHIEEDEENPVRYDTVSDWFQFWTPLDAVLYKKLNGLNN